MTTPAPEEDVSAAVAEGYSFACAHCERLWRHRLRGAPGCAAPSPCGCVLDGNTLPHYRGPLDLQKQCYICGELADNLVSVPGAAGRLGVCRAHAKYLARTPTKAVVLLHSGPVILPVSSLLPRFRYKLADLLAEFADD